MKYPQNDGDNLRAKVTATSGSSDTPDEFDELNQLFQEAENQLETELASALGMSETNQSNIKQDPSDTATKP
eukprot:CAMPEP_0170331626 /NCGR_PEP_ID=MMETSP0116_2-20130129/66796_1 /TAXON_ID=400756 /ORGANISM="Durinskia baltica, Strain CSIRO CS-38" /LENGTH=71 /DNA_ID=CAMNT_0010584895 /DNA_START=72 /DNA_END=284 /DNA_ORIENTATION=+